MVEISIKFLMIKLERINALDFRTGFYGSKNTTFEFAFLPIL